MLGTPKRDRRAERRATTRREILDEAWALAHEHGLAGISLRDLAARVGMQAPSLYSYFGSKAEIYDAMFGQGATELLERVDRLRSEADPDDLLRGAQMYVQFCIEDPIRYQLLFQRTIPGFEPSAESYAAAVATLDATRTALSAAGIRDDRALDLFTALLTGIVDQQLSNDPGGDRWTRLVPEAVDMFRRHHTKEGR